jgi:FkbM family methyltransferase
MTPDKPKLPTTLFIKSLMIRTPLEPLGRRLRWLLGSKHRHKHPELWEMYLEEQRIPLVLKKVLKDDSCCVDVGGHIGSFLNLLQRYAPRGRHSVFEASPTKSEWLRRRFPEMKVFSCAVAAEDGKAVFEEDYARPGYSALQREGKNSSARRVRYEVETRRLDDVLADVDRIDLIKLDIEGGELAALRGASKLIEQHKPVIIFECGSEYEFAEQKLSKLDIYRFVTEELNYRIFGLADFIFDKGEMGYDEFRKCGLYPFRGFNFVALPKSTSVTMPR